MNPELTATQIHWTNIVRWVRETAKFLVTGHSTFAVCVTLTQREATRVNVVTTMYTVIGPKFLEVLNKAKAENPGHTPMFMVWTNVRSGDSGKLSFNEGEA